MTIDECDKEFITNRYYNIRWTYKNYPCGYNNLKDDDKFPLCNQKYDDIKGIFCSDNIQISRLPKLPIKLEMLWCGGNNITDLGNFPETLKLLSCYENPLIDINISEIATPDISFYVASWTKIYQLYDLPECIIKLFAGATNLKYISEQNYKNAKRIWLNTPRNLDLRDTIILQEYENSHADFFS